MSTSTFTNAFDNTFLSPPVAQPAKLGDGGCLDSFRLGWLTPIGWCYWTFEAPTDQGLAVTSQGSYLRDQVRRDTRRQTDPTLLLRTATLDAGTRSVLSTVFNSSAVFLLAVDSATGNLSATPVRVTPGDVIINRTRQPYDNLSVQVTLPVRYSFRTL